MPGNLRPISAGAITGSNTIDLDGNLFGGFDLNADGTNAATIEIRDSDASGTVLCDSSSVVGKVFRGPIRAPSGTIYYSIAGTGGSATLYEWTE